MDISQAMIAAVVCGVLGVGFLGWSAVRLLRINASRGWPGTAGQIVESGVATTTDSEGDKTYRLAVHYRFVVNGAEYTGKLVNFGTPYARSPARLQPVADRYPVGAAVTVYYDPRNPERAVLEPGKLSEAAPQAATGALLLIGALLITVWATMPR